MTYQCPCGAFVALEELRRTPGGRYVCAECDHKLATGWGLQPVDDGRIERDSDGMPTVFYPPMRRRERPKKPTHTTAIVVTEPSE